MSKYFSGILISFISLVITLSIVEGILRLKGVQPGLQVRASFFKKVDLLYILDGYYADSNGVFCISQEARDYISNELKSKNHKNVVINDRQCPKIYSLVEEFLKLRDKSYHSEFKSFLEKVEGVNDSADLEFYNAVREYAICPINSNGFKSIEFKKYNSKRKSILLLGDSFTWGHSASNLTNCFADMLLAKGYVVYNTGISGVDPPQYLELAKHLIPKLEPDYVVVNFYMGNDIQYFNRILMPFKPLLYMTNAGDLFSCPEGVYFDNAQDAYKFSLTDLSIPQETVFDRLCAKTAVTTLLWESLPNDDVPAITLPQYSEYLKKVRQAKTTFPYSDILIKQIKELSEKYNAKFLLVVIPKLNDGKFIFPDIHPELFKELKYSVPPVELKHYRQFTDGHYNDLGHAMHAAFLDSLVRNN